MVRRWIGFTSVAIFFFAVCGEGSAQQKWVGTWATAPMAADGGWALRNFSATTLRQVVHVSAGGQQIRVRFSNEFGTTPLKIMNAYAALSAGGSTIQDGTSKAILFNGMKEARIPAGAVMYSDATALTVQPLSDVVISFYLPSQVMRTETYHASANQDNYIANGDQATTKNLTEVTSMTSWYFLTGVEILAQGNARAIVTLGDSITDGAASTKNTNSRWPDVLAARLQKDSKLKQVSVLNMGIGGNRVLNDGAGPNALARLNSALLAQNGVRYLMILESINDIGHLFRTSGPEDEITAEDLKLALQQIVNVAHQHGVKVIGATVTPYGGAGYSSEKGEKIRKAVNDWIRTSGTFDGVADFDKITQTASDPDRFDPRYDSGDHLHPSDAGYKAMGEGIDLKLFE